MASWTAAGFTHVAAVIETAVGGQCVDVIEGDIHRVLVCPELQLTHAGRVDHDSTTLGHDHLAPGRRMPAATIGLSHGADALHVGLEHAVDQRRLTHAG